MIIELKNVDAGYVKDVPVIRNVSLAVEPESITTVIGPNGSGKSTLLKSIMGLATQFAGGIALDGEEIASLPVHERVMKHSVAFVPQLANVFGPLTIAENLEVGGARLSRQARRARIEELFESYPDLASRRRVRAESLSGGQRQLLALARALMTSPKTLLLDEPSAGLSPLMMDELFDAIARIRDHDQVTVLLVEQNAVQSLEISDVGVVLVAGEIALQGPAKQILNDPRVGELYLGSVPAN